MFLQKRESYLARVQEALQSGVHYVPTSIVSSINYDLLTSLISIGEFDEISSIEELTDSALLLWLQSQVG